MILKYAPGLAWSLIGLGLALMVISTILGYWSRTVELPEDWGRWYGGLILMLPFIIKLVIAGIIINKLPKNVFGWVTGGAR